MAIVVNHNLPAMNANRMLNINNNALSKSLEKLSSGLKINRAADDASGLSISEKMRAQVRGLDQASANSEDGVSLIQTADGALDTTEQMLQRMRELTVKGNTETLADEDLQAIADEMKTLAQGINQIAERTEFNTKKLLTGDMSSAEITGQQNVEVAFVTTDEASLRATAGVTAQTGRNVTAGTTMQFRTAYTATETATIQGGTNGATVDLKYSAKNTITSGTTIKFDTTNGKATGHITMKVKFTADTTLKVSANITVTAGSSMTVATGNKLKITDSCKIKYVNDTTVGLNSAGSTTPSIAVLSAGTTVKFNAYVANTAGNTGIMIKDADGNITKLTAHTTALTGEYEIVSGKDGSLSATLAGKLNGKASAIFKAGDIATLETNDIISAGTTFVLSKDRKSTAADTVTINIKAGDVVTYSANRTITAGTTFKTQTNNVVITGATTLKMAAVVSAGGTLTLTSGSTIAAYTDFTYGSDYKATAAITVKGENLTVSAGTTVTAGSTLLEKGDEMVLQTGANAAQVTKFEIGNMAFSAITTNKTGADITKTDTTYGTAGVTYSAGACLIASAITTETACSQETLLALDVAINAVSTQRSKLGAVQNQLEYTIKNLDNTSENLSSAESRIRDTDMAKEMMNYTKYNILSQASQSMLAQANQQPQSVLSLLQ